MQNDILTSLARLADSELVDRVKRLVTRERDAMAELIAHLAEMESREVHLREGYRSLYLYCRDALALSEWEAYNRIEVARLARRFPVVLQMLADGSVNLTTIRLLAPHLTPENHREVLDRARGMKKAEVRELVAGLSPRPDVRASIRRVPEPSEQCRVETVAGDVVVDARVAGDSGVAASNADHSTADTTMARLSPIATASPRTLSPLVTPLSPDRYKLQVTISGETLEKIRLAKDMLGHAVPSGDDATILDRAFTALLVALARKKFADTPKPKPSAPRERASCGATGSVGAMRTATRTVPAAVKRAVWVRDVGRCAFVGEGGHRCNERRFVEFHHVDPHALGGEATVRRYPAALPAPQRLRRPDLFR